MNDFKNLKAEKQIALPKNLINLILESNQHNLQGQQWLAQKQAQAAAQQQQQEEEEPYSAEPYQDDNNSSNTIINSNNNHHNIHSYNGLQHMNSYPNLRTPQNQMTKTYQIPQDVKIQFDGEQSDTFVLISGLSPDTLSMPLPGGRKLTLLDNWRDVRYIVEDPIVASTSSLGSIHDRAVETFYQLVGGQVDYGHSHSSRFGHKRYGENYEVGLFPEWSADNPIVLIGKGTGGTVAHYLQHLISIDYFGKSTSGKWVKAVICLSTPHRGSVLPYILGLIPGTRTSISDFSFLKVFLTIIHLICYFTFLDTFFGFKLNSKWPLARSTEGGEQTLWDSLCARSPFTYCGDNFLVDLSVEGARSRYATEDWRRQHLDPGVVYINYITTGQSWRSRETGYHWPRFSWRNWPNAIFSFILGIGQHQFTRETEQQVLRTPSSNFWENDGTLSVYSQQPQPHQPIAMNIALPEKLFDPVDHELQSGSWYNVYVEDLSHTVLFDKEPFLLTLPLINAFLELSFMQQLVDWFERNSEQLEEYYITSVEFVERTMMNFRMILKWIANKKTSNKRSSTMKFSNANNNKVTKQQNNPIYLNATQPNIPLSLAEKCQAVDRFERHASDKAGIEWIRRVETMAVTNPFTANNVSSAFAAGDGPMFINKARRRMTANEYKASVIGNSSRLGVTSGVL
ncbi:9244_t:CDS:2 [Ambispora leptoticha]|uniref:9244_t:CDS:1 n=1 Tax=Ambispora leptoticha TaxID=144679 RepID=A0A9N9AAP2_9GLOM|nr:9244_t:CDS:2 [Ambispora leptoticha]